VLYLGDEATEETAFKVFNFLLFDAS
jgi:hypothetical protein